MEMAPELRDGKLAWMLWMLKTLREPHLYRVRRMEGTVALRWSWMLAAVRYGSGAKSSGDCHVLRAPVKYWRGQKTRSCCSS